MITMKILFFILYSFYGLSQGEISILEKTIYDYDEVIKTIDDLNNVNISQCSIFLFQESTTAGGSCGPSVDSGSPQIKRWIQAPDKCFEEIKPNNCSFYKECLDNKFLCSQTNFAYPSDYGDKYCNSFLSQSKHLSTFGKLWVTSTMTCLQEKLQKEFHLNRDCYGVYFSEKGRYVKEYDINRACAQIEKIAFDSHPGCYLNPSNSKPNDFGLSICTLPQKDINVITSTAGLGDVLKQENRVKLYILKQIQETFSTCAKNLKSVLVWMLIRNSDLFIKLDDTKSTNNSSKEEQLEILKKILQLKY